jgi:aminotransferase EvaB
MGRKVPINDLGRHARATRDVVQLGIDRVLDSGWYILGKEGQAFEAEFAAYCGTAHAVGMASGTDALELALRAVGIERGMKVATVANAGGYSTTALSSIGALPVYVDVDPRTHLMNLNNLLQVIGEVGIDAVIVTHLYGRLHDMAAVMRIGDEAGIPVIEDCAQAHGATRNGKRSGSFAQAGCFSFYPTKNLGALGDAGLVTTSDPDLAEHLRQLRQYGWQSKYRVGVAGGRNSRLDEMQAAILRAKLPHLDAWNTRRRVIAEQYSQRIKNPRLDALPATGEDYVGHLYVVCCDDRGGLQRHLESRGISTDIHYPVPDHLQPAWHEQHASASLPVTEMLADRVLTLPCFPELEAVELEAVIAAINDW